VKRTFKDLVPRSESLRKRLRQVLSGGAIAGMGLTPAPVVQAKDLATPATDSSPVTIVNRSQKAKKLILQLPSGTAYRMLQHRSHSSHASHKSHSSHYSGSSGSSSTPAPKPTPAPARRALESPPPKADAEALPYFIGTIETINKETRTITVKQTETNLQYPLGYRDDTTIRSLLGTELRLDDAIEKNNGALPFVKGQKIQVTWKQGTNARNIAVTITHIK
jgi:hypothetical protein